MKHSNFIDCNSPKTLVKGINGSIGFFKLKNELLKLFDFILTVNFFLHQLLINCLLTFVLLNKFIMAFIKFFLVFGGYNIVLNVHLI